jgi:hypothetical protein
MKMWQATTIENNSTRPPMKRELGKLVRYKADRKNMLNRIPRYFSNFIRSL